MCFRLQPTRPFLRTQISKHPVPATYGVDMCMDLCVDMCTDVNIDLCVDMYIDMCIDMYVDMCNF